jgi:hypothetical protein
MRKVIVCFRSIARAFFSCSFCIQTTMKESRPGYDCDARFGIAVLSDIAHVVRKKNTAGTLSIENGSSCDSSEEEFDNLNL